MGSCLQIVQLAASEGDRTARSFGGGPPAGVTQAQGVPGHGARIFVSSHTSVTVLRGGEARITVTRRPYRCYQAFLFPSRRYRWDPFRSFESG